MSPKQFEFTGKAGEFFVAYLVSIVTSFIPIFGPPIGFNYINNWVANNSLINGKKVVYTAKYGETLKFLFINTLILIITVGIYTFWFVPKSYRFIADHLTFADAVPVSPVAAAPVSPISPDPVAPQSPTVTPPSVPQPPAPQPPVVSA